MFRLTSVLKRGPWRYLSDRDVLHAAAITGLAVVATGGIVWAAYWLHVWRVARRSPLTLDRAMTVLVFGRKLVHDEPEADFQARLARALALVRHGQSDTLLLLGGHGGGRLSEAAAGAAWLHQRGLPAGTRVVLEQASIDSLENLRHARALLQEEGPLRAGLPPVALVTSRYHLARCRMLARRLGFDRCYPVGAEDRLSWNVRLWKRLAAESGYVMWIDLGWRWARLIGHERMVTRLS
ncbi:MULTISPECIES: YdcF family protein [Dyella]|uniref:YdcF family protein n=1 Tax=Dyella TaxID=231454 RepID=UPI001F0DEB89|nr:MULTISPECIES: YdcF family protein [Dyella]